MRYTFKQLNLSSLLFGMTTIGLAACSPPEIKHTFHDAPSSTEGVSAGPDTTDSNPAPPVISKGPNLSNLGPAILKFSASNLDFGVQSVNSRPFRSLTISNTGKTAASHIQGFSSGDSFEYRGGAYPGIGGDCDENLGTDESCTVVIAFKVKNLGSTSGRIRLSYTITADQSRETELKTLGTGAAYPTLEFAESTTDFGTQLVGAQTTRTLNVLYYGMHAATGIAGSQLSAPFNYAGGRFPGTDGTCSDQISSNCTLVINFTAAAPGNATQPLRIKYSNGAYATDAAVTLSANAVAAPTPGLLTITPLPSNSENFGARKMGTTNKMLFRVQNSGSLRVTEMHPLIFSDPAFTFEGGSYPGLAGNCAGTLPSDCILSINFTPKTEGTIPSSIAITYMDSVSTLPKLASLAIQGIGVMPATLNFTGTSQGTQFPAAPVNFKTTREFVFQNSSNTASVTDVAVTITGSSFQIASQNCGATLAPQEKCSVFVTFKPGQASALLGNISFAYTDGFASQKVDLALSGTGTAAAYLVLEATSLDFSSLTVGGSKTLPLLVHYYGLNPATGLDLGQVNQNGFTADLGTCSSAFTQDCTLQIKFQPNGSGTFSRDAQLGYSDGVQAQNLGLNLSVKGVGLTPAKLTLTANPSSDFGDAPVGFGKTRTIQVTNSGESAAINPTLLALASPFSVLSNDCPANLNASQSCNFKILFQPLTSGVASSLVKMNYSNGALPTSDSITLTGKGTSLPIVGFNGNIDQLPAKTISYNFWNVLVGAEKAVTFSLNYYGTQPARFISVASLSGPDFFYGNGGGFPGASAGSGVCTPGQISQACNFVIKFKPSALGTLTGTFALTYDDGLGNPVLIQIQLSGTGVKPATLVLNPSTPSFAPTPAHFRVTQTLTLSNSASAGANAVITSIQTLSAPFAWIGGSCLTATPANPIQLAPGASCGLDVAFLPNASGNFTQNFAVNFNDGVNPQQATFGMTGTGTDAAFLMVNTGEKYDLGSIVSGTQKTVSIQLQAYGTFTARFLSIATSSPFEVLGAPSSSCLTGGTLAPVNSCQISIRYTADVPGSSSANLVISYDDGSGHSPTLTVNLTARSLSPAILALQPVNLGVKAVGSTNPFQLQVTSTGETAATAVTLSSVSAPLSFVSSTCAATVNGSCAMTLQFSPTTAGSFQQTITVSYFDGVATQTASAQVTATSIVAGQLALSPASDFDFGRTALGQSRSLKLTLSNVGTGAISQLSLGIGQTSGAFKILDTDCGPDLAIRANCTVNGQFQPKVPGDVNDIFQTTYSNGQSSVGLNQNWKGIGTVTVQLATRGDHTCVITSIGQLHCWGRNDYGAVGNGNINLGTGLWPVSLAAGFYHSCAVLSNGQVKCWGRNDVGQLGLEDTQDRGLSAGDLGDQLPPTKLGTGRTAKAVYAGFAHTCALLDNDTLKCWGQNMMGQLGLGDTITRGNSPGSMGDSLPVVNLGTNRKPLSVSLSAGHSCALLDDQTLKCWGDNFYGQLGLEDYANRGIAPAQMGDALPSIQLGPKTGFTGVISVSTGGGFTCAILIGGQTKCWGYNYHGTLGTCWGLDSNNLFGACYDPGFSTWVRGYGFAASQMGSSLPIVDLGTNWNTRLLSSGNFFSCAISQTGALKCFGDNAKGQLGLGDLNSRGDKSGDMGTALPGLDLGSVPPIRQLSAGNEHVCALFEDESVKCWGSNQFGQLLLPLATSGLGTHPGEMGSALPLVLY